MVQHNSRIINWLHRIEKPFGYTRITLNHIRLLYWILGEFYYSKIFHRRFTIFWISYNAIHIVFFFSHCASYVFFTPDPPFTTLLLTGNMTMIGIYLGILIPMASYACHEHSFEAFKLLDQTVNVELHEDFLLPPQSVVQLDRPRANSADMAIISFVSQFAIVVCYIICTNLHLLLGYTKIKLNDPISYFYPVYCEPVQNMVVFFTILICQLLAASPLMISYLFMPPYMMLVASELYNKFRFLDDSVKSQSRAFMLRYEELLNDNGTAQEINRKRMFNLEDSFLKNIRSCAQFHEKLLRALSKLRPYLEMNMSLSIVMFMYLEVVLFYLFVLVDNSVILKMKNMIYGIIICTIFFAGCLTGTLFSDMVRLFYFLTLWVIYSASRENMFRDTVYDIPWYYLSPVNRKFVKFLLFRTHVKREFKALHVYPMSMELFLKFCRHVYSVVNVLRRVTIIYTV